MFTNCCQTQQWGTGLETLIIPSSGEIIGAGAFRDSLLLKVVEFESNTRVSRIDSIASGWSNITKSCFFQALHLQEPRSYLFHPFHRLLHSPQITINA
jgi:hypothetical protein